MRNLEEEVPSKEIPGLSWSVMWCVHCTKAPDQGEKEWLKSHAFLT